MQFKFKASRDAADGLIFYAGKGHHFISIELREGSLLFQFKLGEYSDVVKIGSRDQFNDENWHSVEASRERSLGMLKVDQQVIHQNSEFVVPEDNLEISEYLYFGGHPDQIHHPDVTKKHFDGCIEDVYIAEVPVDLSSNLKAYDVRPGCPNKFSSILSFFPKQPGHLKKYNVTAENHAHINLKFKTKQPSGIIFYFNSKDQKSTLTLSLKDGILVLRSSREELNSGINRYDNGEWHVVTAIHLNNKLKLSVDDVEVFESDVAPPPLHISQGEIYFGGLPESYSPLRGAIASTSYFVGCISDVTVNGQVVNFADSTDKKNAVLNNCHRDLFEYDPTLIPTFYPDGTIEEPIVTFQRGGISESEGTKKPDTFSVEENLIPDDNDEKKEMTTEVIPPLTAAPETTTELPTTKSTSTTPAIETLPSKRTRPVTTKPTKRPLPPDQICVLPKKPAYDDTELPFRFGALPASRIEIKIPTHGLNAKFDFKLEFRTSQKTGVLFIVSDSDIKSILAVYLKDGHVHFVAKTSNSNPVELVSNAAYNDDEWHEIEFSREKTKLTLKLDQNDVKKGEFEYLEKGKPMITLSPFIVGGYDANKSTMSTELNVDHAYLNITFNGCIDNIKLNNAIIDLGEDSAKFIDVIPCSEAVEDGIFFQDGILKLSEKFTVGSDLTVSMDIKPRTDTSILMSVHGKSAFFILQLVNGTVVFSVDSGKGPLVTVYKPDEDENLCDGEWHTVKAVKSAYVITVSVDNRSSEPSLGDASSYVTQTTRPLFIGGHPHMQKVI